MRRRFREACSRSPSAAAACAWRAPRIRAFGGALPILTICWKYIEFLSGAAEYRVGRLAPGSLMGKGPLLVTVRTIEIQFPRKSHSLPPCSVASAISGKRYRNFSRCCVTIRYKVNCDLSMRNPASPRCPCSSRWVSTFSATPRRVLQALPNRPIGQRHKSARHQSIGQRGAINREALVRALSGLIGRRGGFTMSIVAWVTLTVPVCLARTRLVAPCRWSAISPTTASFNRLSAIPVGAEGLSGEEAARGCWCHTAAATGTRAVPRCFG